MSYTTKAKVEGYLGIDISSSLDSVVSGWVIVITAWIEKYTGKSFEASAVSERFFDGNDCSELLVDSFVADSITQLKIRDRDGNVTHTLTEGIGNGFITYPLNKTEKNTIKLTSNNVGSFPSGAMRVAITAKWGVAQSVPSDIEIVATKLLSSLIEKSLNGGKLADETMGDHTVTFAEIDEVADAMGVYQTLDMYRDIPI